MKVNRRSKTEKFDHSVLLEGRRGRYPFESIHEEIIKACKERGITYLDGYVPFAGYYSLKRFIVHPLDYHPNGLSNRKLVDYLHKKYFIRDFILERKDSSL